MAKYFGKIGFAEDVETSRGVWVNQITERDYQGDLIRNIRKTETSSSINDNINISNEISIIADPYANKNLHSIKYITFMGVKWKVVSISVEYPRLILSIGGEYHSE